MFLLTASDAEQLKLLAERVDKVHGRMVEMIQELHGLRAQLAGIPSTLALLLQRATDRGAARTSPE